MNTKRVLIIAATLLMASQAYAMTAYEKNHGCNHDAGNCPDQGGGGGAGGGDGGGVSENAIPTYAFISEGSLWEGYGGPNGGFAIETELVGGKTIVHDDAGNSAFLIKPPPAKEAMKRSALVHGPMTPAKITPDAAKQKAEKAKLDKAKAEFQAGLEKKAAAEKAAAEAKAKADKAFQDKMAAQDAADNQAAADKMKAEAAKAKAEMDKKAMNLAKRTPVMAPAIAAAASGARTKP